MENCTNGSGNCNGTTDASDFAAFGLLITAMGGLTFALGIPAIIALCMAHAVAKVLRVYLISALVSGFLISGPFTLSSLIVFVTVFFGTPPPPLLLCRFVFWVHNIGSVARSFSVAGFSIMVLVVVRYGKSTIKLPYIVLSVLAVWGLSILLTIQYQVPQVYAVKYTAGVVCLPVQDGIFIEARLFFTALLLIIISLVPLIVCIVVPLAVLCYIKKHSVTADNGYGKAIAKLGLFLVTGNLINAIGVMVFSILLYVTSVGGARVIYSVYVIVLLSLYPTPILIVTYLKPVRDQMKSFLMCLLHCLPLTGLRIKSEKTVATVITNKTVWHYHGYSAFTMIRTHVEDYCCIWRGLGI